jgi:two-component system, OmpR family, osmolarity sensor histidine kinase EnvZ
VHLELRAPENRLFAADSVRHALLNLVQNALEYGRPPVTVRTSSSAAEIQIEVHDRGAGLTEAEWSEAVRPFHRLRAPPGGTHTGLGLAMVDRLVHVSGGRLDAKRTVDGFVIVVRLPADPSV